MDDILEELLNAPKQKQNLLYGKPIPEDVLILYKGVYDSMGGRVPRCPFTETLNHELGLEYATND